MEIVSIYTSAVDSELWRCFLTCAFAFEVDADIY